MFLPVATKLNNFKLQVGVRPLHLMTVLSMYSQNVKELLHVKP